MKRIGTTLLLLLLLVLAGCNGNIKKQLDSETLSSLESIYNKADTKESFNRWLKRFDNYTITYSDEYTYVIGSIDTNINIFSYETFEIVDDYWVIDSINTNVKLYEQSHKENLDIKYGKNDHWIINNHDTNIEIIYRDLTVTFNLNGVGINEKIDNSRTTRENNIIALPQISSNDYKFVGWAFDNNPNDLSSDDLRVLSNYNLYAIWEHPYLDLELNANNEYVIKGLTKNASSVYIPTTFNGRSVTTISSSFSNNYADSVENIYVSGSITNVEQSAFSGIYGKGITIINKSQTNTWNSNWRDGSYLTVKYLSNEKDDYYKTDSKTSVKLTDFDKTNYSGNITPFSNTDSSINRKFYYWSKNVTSTQEFVNGEMYINITKPSNLSSYILQINDLMGTMPLIRGLNYRISFMIKTNNADSIFAVCLSKDNNATDYFYQEYTIGANVYTLCSFEFECEDPNLFFKIYLGKTVAKYYIKDFSISYNYVKYIESEISSFIPSVIYNSFDLPKFNDSELSINYKTSAYKIENNQFVYTDPDGREKITLSSIINYGGKTYYKEYSSIVRTPFAKIPEIRITLSDSTKISETDDYSRMVLDCIEYDLDNNATHSLSEASGGIRVRGNSTRTFPKKPYRIKFDSKQSFFGLPKAKSWVLLANHSDQSLMRAYLAYTLGQKFDNMDFAPSAYYVDLYVNDVYYGNYMLTEQMQVGKGRVDIDSDPVVVDTGYLLEYDMHIEGDDGVDYFRLNGENSVYFIKSPDRSDGLTDSQFEFIKDYITRVDTAIRTRNGYEKLIDVDSFIDFFIMQEIFKNIDCNQESIYMYKEEGSKLKMGPIWDFDLSAGNDVQDPNAVKTDGWFSFQSYKNKWIYNLMKDPKVANRFVERWHKKYEDILEMVDSVYEIYDFIVDSAYRNFEVDDVIGKEKTWYTVDAVYNIKTYEGQVDYLYNWLVSRVKWINMNIDSLAS